MIKYDLRCSDDHQFEAWFPDSKACDSQLAGGEVLCPHCGSADVRKALMAPAIGRRDKEESGKKQAMALAQHIQMLREFRRQVEENCDNVGADFPEEARKIHYGEAEYRNIFGEASLAEAEELIEEGIDVFPVPGPFRDDA